VIGVISFLLLMDMVGVAQKVSQTGIGVFARKDIKVNTLVEAMVSGLQRKVSNG